MSKVRVSIVVGSESDRDVASKAEAVLRKLDIPCEVRVFSAHRTPRELEEYIDESEAEVFIGIAGLSAHLPGFIASRTFKPVIGVPKSVKLGGLDALLSIVQMPRRVPVACVGVDNGENAGWLAARILALTDPPLEERLLKS